MPLRAQGLPCGPLPCGPAGPPHRPPKGLPGSVPAAAVVARASAPFGQRPASGLRPRQGSPTADRAVRPSASRRAPGRRVPAWSAGSATSPRARWPPALAPARSMARRRAGGRPVCSRGARRTPGAGHGAYAPHRGSGGRCRTRARPRSGQPPPERARAPAGRRRTAAVRRPRRRPGCLSRDPGTTRPVGQLPRRPWVPPFCRLPTLAMRRPFNAPAHAAKYNTSTRSTPGSGAPRPSGTGAPIAMPSPRETDPTEDERMAGQRSAAFIDALRALEAEGNVEAIASLFTDDAELSTPTDTAPHRGTSGARTFWENYRRTFAEIDSEFRHV